MLHARVAYAIQGFDFERAGSVLQAGSFTMPLVHECADGYAVLTPTGAVMRKMVYWLVEDGIVPETWIEDEDWPTYDLRIIQQQPVTHELEEVVDAIRRYAIGHTKAELLERGLKENVTVAPVSTMEDLTRFRQLEERGYWLMAPLPDGREVPVPGIMVRMSETPLTVRQWAPTLGQHNQEVLGEMLGMTDDQIAAAGGAVTS